MRRMAKKPPRPRDPNQLARHIVDLATGDAADPDPGAGKMAAAVELGRRGGLKGGAARAAKLSDERRSEIARTAAKIRWRGESGQE